MNRRAMILASLAALPATALLAPAGAQSRRTAGWRRTARRQRSVGLTATAVRTRIVTRTFTNTVPIATPLTGQSSPYPATLQVGGFRQGRLLKVRLALIGLSHPAPAFLDIMLVAPGNKGVIIMSDAGGASDVSGLTLIFDQDAPGRLPDVLTTGVFQPANLDVALDPFPTPAPASVTGHSLNAFNNRNPNGIWRLFVVVDGNGDFGSIGGWSLTIRARIRLPQRRLQRKRNQRRRPARRAIR